MRQAFRADIVGPSLKYEWLRLRTIRSPWLVMFFGLMGSAAASALYSWLVMAVSDTGLRATRSEAFMVCVTKPCYAPFVTGLLGWLSFAGERRYGGLVSALIHQPDRTRLLLTRMISTSCLGTALAVPALLINWIVASLILGGGSVDVGFRRFMLAMLAILVAGLWWAMFGIAVGVFIRSPLAGLGLFLFGPVVVGRAISIAALADPSGASFSGLKSYSPFEIVGRLQLVLPVDNPVILAVERWIPWSSSLIGLVGSFILILAAALRCITTAEVLID